MSKRMGYLFCIIAAYVLFFGFSIQATDNILHSIYQQLVYISGCLLWCSGTILISLDSKKDLLKKILNKLEENKS